jgi:hypothetical protein
MAKFTKKWLKDFEKRMKNHFKELESLENEYQEMVDTNPDQWELNRWSPMEHHTFKKSSGLGIYHNSNVPEGEEYIEIGVSASSISGFAFPVYELKELIEFRNRLTEAIDAFERPIEKVKETINSDDCEDEEEGWEENEYSEYTIQASRTCVQTWTHTVQARSSCEAYRLVQEDDDGSTHDQNDDYDDYGEIDYEII